MAKPNIKLVTENSEAPPVHAQKNKPTPKYLTFYVVGIFSMALLLMLMSYLSQRRAEDQSDRILNQHNEFSKSAMSSMERLQNENSELRDSLERERAEKQELADKLKNIERDMSALADENIRQQEQMQSIINENGQLKAQYNELLELQNPAVDVISN